MNVLSSLSQMQSEVHQVAVEHGWWWAKEKRTFGDSIALIHSEVSEALEAWRDRGFEKWYEEKPEGQKPEGVGPELADAVIRIMDLAERSGIDLQAEIIEKNAYNKVRPFRHGGKQM